MPADNMNNMPAESDIMFVKIGQNQQCVHFHDNKQTRSRQNTGFRTWTQLIIHIFSRLSLRNHFKRASPGVCKHTVHETIRNVTTDGSNMLLVQTFISDRALILEHIIYLFCAGCQLDVCLEKTLLTRGDGWEAGLRSSSQPLPAWEGNTRSQDESCWLNGRCRTKGMKGAEAT